VREGQRSSAFAPPQNEEMEFFNKLLGLHLHEDLR